MRAKPSCSIRSTEPTGYVLVTVLLLLTIAATALAAVARESHRLAIEARNADETLQQRWGAISCQQMLLPRAGDLIEAAGKRLTKPVARINVMIMLNGTSFKLVLSDEQAKANINLLTRYLPPRMQIEMIETLAGPAAAIRLLPIQDSDLLDSQNDGAATTKSLHESPATTQATDDPSHPQYFAYGQFLTRAGPQELVGGNLLNGQADHLTCWGDEKLNTTCASPVSVMAVAATVLEKDELVRFTSEQKKSTDRDWKELFQACNVLPDKVQLMKNRVTDVSACHSMWVVSNSSGRTKYRFAVISEPSNVPQVFEY
jgi:hypothetical protein